MDQSGSERTASSRFATATVPQTLHPPVNVIPSCTELDSLRLATTSLFDFPSRRLISLARQQQGDGVPHFIMRKEGSLSADI